MPAAGGLFCAQKQEKEMPLYAYGTMPEIPPETVTEKHADIESNESEEN